MQYPHRARPFARSLPGFGGLDGVAGRGRKTAPGPGRWTGAWTGSAGPP